MQTIQRILSGVRPTGDIHLGNYLGAIRNWVNLQEISRERLFCIVDMHALTTSDDAHNLASNTRTVAAAYIACGINPDTSAIFAQSQVPAHLELAWILSCITPLGWLNRMTQFKDKAGSDREKAFLGLYSYPVLMAADILIYNATNVPVGDDQKQHVELARDIAGAFNRHYKTETFVLPEPHIIGTATRVMSLRDGSKKMSKSDLSDYSRINLMDDPDTIVLKIKKSKTDSDPIPEKFEDLGGRVEAKNLITIYATVTDQSCDVACAQFSGQTFSVLKNQLADALVNLLSPIREKMHFLLNEKSELDKILKIGAEKANNLAVPHLKEIRKIIGIEV